MRSLSIGLVLMCCGAVVFSGNAIAAPPADAIFEARTYGVPADGTTIVGFSSLSVGPLDGPMLWMGYRNSSDVQRIGLDLTDPDMPVFVPGLVSPFDLGDDVNPSAISGGVLLGTNTRARVNTMQGGAAFLFDATDPTNPVALSKFGSDTPNGDSRFGTSAAHEDGIALIGAHLDADMGTRSGAAYLFDISDPTDPTQLSKFWPNDTGPDQGFGTGIRIDGDRAIVGRYFVDDFAAWSAYLFDISDPANPTQLFEIKPSENQIFDAPSIGGLALTGGFAYIGTRGIGDFFETRGRVFIYDAVTGQQVTALDSDSGVIEGDFGNSLRVHGDTMLVTAPRDDPSGTGENVGAVYVYDVSNPAMPQRTGVLLASDGADEDYFGFSIAWDGGDTVYVAAPNHEPSPGAALGQIYVFDISDEQLLCAADFDGDDDVDLTDFGTFGSMTGDVNYNPDADFDDDGDVDLTDFGTFGSEFGNGAAECAG